MWDPLTQSDVSSECLTPNSYVVYWGSFGWLLFGQSFGGVADVEGANDVPVGFGSYCGAYVGEAGFACTPADSDAERVCCKLKVLNGAGGSCVVLLSHFVVTALNRVDVNESRGVEYFLLCFL